MAALPPVRDFLLDFQRRQAMEHDVVMDGRDIGTVVLPHAGAKVFLTAAPEARARRRLLELKQRGQETELETVLRDIVQRDEQDRNRAVAPLRQAEDAVLLDTTEAGTGGEPEGPDLPGEREAGSMSTEQFYRFLYLVVWPFFNLFHPVRTVGREHIPEGAAVICPNHTALSDPFFVAFAFQKKNPSAGDGQGSS